jgi:hypothetical protein
MFHAAAMSVETNFTFDANQVMVNMTGHCDEQKNTSALPAVKCSPLGHLCCLGLMATVAKSSNDFSMDIGGLVNPMVSTLDLQHRPNKLYKPPKFSLLS